MVSTCTVCKTTPSTESHHVYLFDDGNQKTPKYPSWVIAVCHSCNIKLGGVNKFLKNYFFTNYTEDVRFVGRVIVNNNVKRITIPKDICLNTKIEGGDFIEFKIVRIIKSKEEGSDNDIPT